jgi:hypothetical protein
MIRDRLGRQLVASNAAARAAGRTYDISLCVGVAHAQPGGVGADGTPESLTTLMVEADERLYAEKAASKQRRA